MRGVPLVLLAYLLLQERRVSRDHLAELFWPGPHPKHSRQSLRQALFRLRGVLPEGTIKGSEELSASAHDLTTDIHQFHELIRDHRVGEALDLWRGPFLGGFGRPESWALEEWIERERARLDSLLKSAVTTVANAWIEDDQAQRCLDLLRRARVALPEVQEIAVLEVRALAEAGRVPEAEGALATMDLDPDDDRLKELDDDIDRARGRMDVPIPQPASPPAMADAGIGGLAPRTRSIIRWTAIGAAAVAAAGAMVLLPVGSGRGIERTEPASGGMTALEESLASVTPGLGVGLGSDQFALIPTGTFQMGSANGEADEWPVHTVNITQPFYMQKTEVTQGQWQAVMGGNPSYFSDCGDTCPVERVSWADFRYFLATLNAQDPGKNYRLPTEAEWEYAARAGTLGSYGGTGVLDEMGWYSGNSGSEPHPVAQKQANAWGLFDMHGNVWEYVQDWCSSDYYSVSPTDDPSGPATGSCRVLRGGSWGGDASYGRSAYRYSYVPKSQGNIRYGFRLVRSGIIAEQDFTNDGTPDVRIANSAMWIQVNRDPPLGDTKGFIEAGGLTGGSSFLDPRRSITSEGMVDQISAWRTKAFSVEVTENSANIGSFKVTAVDTANGKEITREYEVTLEASSRFAVVDYAFTNTGSSSWTYDERSSHEHSGAQMADLFFSQLQDVDAYVNGVGVIGLSSQPLWRSFTPDQTAPFVVLFRTDPDVAMTFGFVTPWHSPIHQAIAVYRAGEMTGLDLTAKAFSLEPGASARWRAIIAFHPGGYVRGKAIYEDASR